MRRGSVKVPVLSGLGAALACPSAADVWAGGDCTRAACASKQPGAKGACKKFGIPWGAVTSAPSGGPLPGSAFFGSGPTVPFGTGTPSLPPPPSSPPPPPPPPPSTPPPPAVCTTDWVAATNDVMGVINSIRSCSSPQATLPAEIAACASGTGTGSGSYGDYLSARGLYNAARETADLLCASETQQPSTGSPYSNPSQPSMYSPYTPYGQNQYGQVQESIPETPMIAPERGPFVSRGAKIGIGGVVLAGAVLWFIMRRKKSHRA